MRRLFTEGWNGLGPDRQAMVIRGLTTITATALLSALGKRLPSPAPSEEGTYESSLRGLRDPQWTNHAGGYWRCRHMGCSKKADPTVMDHECCGRCSPGRNCLRAAQLNYDGPGGFAHNYQEGFLEPGICTVGTCGEPSEAHIWVYDYIHGERRTRD
ncbi:hypothetical protein [Streptomyces sp. NPDC058671]|uniref:hypothetical protein n=1 Tax=Streptomyces sp. NPDC058671 TaxID=3346590 RepID=UPI00365AC40A